MKQQQTDRCFIEPLSPEVSLEMMPIQSGTFTMGSPGDEPERFDDESPQHDVTVNSFFMGRYPITQAQWRAVAAMTQVERELDANPSYFKGDNHPVENVSWDDAVEFCARLSAHTGREYRLPTEAEWEYACRAGTTTPFYFGKTLTEEMANYNTSLTYNGGPKGKASKGTTPVGHFGFANAFGLSDMHGNVWEWCQDQWHDSYQGAPIDGSAWEDRDKDARRVLRGGSWLTLPWYCRSACRYSNTPDYRDIKLGFRVVVQRPGFSHSPLPSCSLQRKSRKRRKTI